MRTYQKTLLSVLAAIFIAVTAFFSVFLQAGVTAYADTGNQAKFEARNVLDDLEGSEIEGEPFSLERFNFDSKKETQLLSFVEFCYSFYENLQSDYGLYLYIYNPKGLKFVTDSSLNMVNLRAGDDKSAPFHKYYLKFLNCSQRADFEGLFYKFKVDFTSTQRQEILDAVNSSSRTYRVAEVELLIQGNLNATSTLVGTTYSFSGYAGGYGSNSESESTLKINSEQADTLSLDVHSTFFRPSGTNGKNEFTQDSLHSVYFAVPNYFIATYGEMSAVHATWLNAVIAPMLVTGNEKAYDAILPFLGKNIGKYTEDLSCHYYGGFEMRVGVGQSYDFFYGYTYNALNPNDININNFFARTKYGGDIETLYAMFFSGNTKNSADSYIVSSDMIKEKILSATKTYGGDLVNGKYSRVLFDSVDADFTEINAKREEEFSLTSEKISKSFWEKLFGGSHVSSSTTFDGIQAIYPVTKEDLYGSKEEVCKRLYISTTEYDEFKNYFEKNYGEDEESNTIYLFRYQISDFISEEATLVSKEFSPIGINYSDTNAYFFQETLNMDFDIIDVTFSNGEKNTRIAVAMSPIDVIPDGTPPVYTTTDKGGGLKWWQILLLIALLILIAVVIYKLVKGGLSLIFKEKKK